MVKALWKAVVLGGLLVGASDSASAQVGISFGTGYPNGIYSTDYGYNTYVPVTPGYAYPYNTPGYPYGVNPGYSGYNYGWNQWNSPAPYYPQSGFYNRGWNRGWNRSGWYNGGYPYGGRYGGGTGIQLGSSGIWVY